MVGLETYAMKENIAMLRLFIGWDQSAEKPLKWKDATRLTERNYE